MPTQESAVAGRWMDPGFHVLSLPGRRRLSNGAAFSSGFRSARVQRRVNPRCPHLRTRSAERGSAVVLVAAIEADGRNGSELWGSPDCHVDARLPGSLM
jgi:hypothetical protein